MSDSLCINKTIYVRVIAPDIVKCKQGMQILENAAYGESIPPQVPVHLI